MIGKIKENEQVKYVVLHMASEGNTLTDEMQYDWWDKLAKMSDGNATVDGLIGAVWAPAHLNGENTRAENIRHAEALDQLADQIKDFANMLRDPDVIYEDETEPEMTKTK